MAEDILRSLGIEPTDMSQRRGRMVEAGQALAGARLTEISRDGQAQATVDGTGVLLGLTISDRPRRAADAPALDAAILEAVRGAKVRAAMAARTEAASALGISKTEPPAVEPVEPPHGPEDHSHHPIARQDDEDEEVSFEEIDFVHGKSDDEQAAW
ncbi:YbaB/EbfC family nucleoid-associated protein [Kutzneria sp. CA-103260]|uniref:YbaB/EbfC family nucleoid-associated protein n=1 Tax=Kutzneria sp. CA-103260 TaxID=2802641 RepID=UPI001BA4480B|nr:YbaB/EbfC family nucleoid-associated protein [Kutzneria sp. CA-103260]